MRMAAKSVALMCLVNKIKIKLMRDMDPQQLWHMQNSTTLWDNLEGDVMHLIHSTLMTGVSPKLMALVNNTFIDELLEVWRR